MGSSPVSSQSHSGRLGYSEEEEGGGQTMKEEVRWEVVFARNIFWPKCSAKYPAEYSAETGIL